MKVISDSATDRSSAIANKPCQGRYRLMQTIKRGSRDYAPFGEGNVVSLR